MKRKMIKEIEQIFGEIQKKSNQIESNRKRETKLNKADELLHRYSPKHHSTMIHFADKIINSWNLVCCFFAAVDLKSHTLLQ